MRFLMKKMAIWYFILNGFCIAGCGAQLVKGRVVDAKTKLPLEGAAVAINWLHYKIGPPGLPTPKDRLGTTQTVTDDKGSFTIPQHTGIGRSYFMGIYKKGYICWSSEKIFNPAGATYDEMYRKRKKPRLYNGMIIELQPIEGQIPLDKHAIFTVNVETRFTIGYGPFYNAIEQEEERFRKIFKKRRN